jgi:hypothetical protein
LVHRISPFGADRLARQHRIFLLRRRPPPLDQLVERRDLDSKPGSGRVMLQPVFRGVERRERANYLSFR